MTDSLDWGWVNDAYRARAGESILPALKKKAFHCPFCQVLAPQTWEILTSGTHETPIHRCECTNCRLHSYWYAAQEPLMLYPPQTSAPSPHPEMPEDVKADYNEAGSILQASPRGAGALLRLALQKLMPHLGETDKNINDAIASLVKKGLDPEIQQALDALRVIGNNAVHPLELDLRDDRETIGALFGLLNYIVEDRIARPKKLEALYSGLPKGARQAIERRDA